MLLVLLACSSEHPGVEVPPITDGEASEAAAAVICEAAAEARMDCVAAGSVATLGEVKLETVASVEGFVTLEPRTIGMGASAQQIPGEVQLVLAIALAVDGAPLMTVDVSVAAQDVDLDKARSAVLDQAVERWMVGYGLAVLDAVAEDPTAPALASVGMQVPAQSSGAMRAWAAYPMLRGQNLDPSTASGLGAGVQSMLGALSPYLDTIDLEGLHSVRVNASLGGSGPPGPCGLVPPVALASGATASIVPLSGVVEVDGEATGTICEMSEAVAWPLPPAGVVLEWEQFMVLRAE